MSGPDTLVERLMARARSRVPEDNPIGMTPDDFLEGQAAAELSALRERCETQLRHLAELHTKNIMQIGEAVIRAEAAERERDRYRFSPQGDNHHNALKCPYCNPGLIDYEARAVAAEAARDAAVAALREMNCPRPCNSRPDDFTVGDCVSAGECGCGNARSLTQAGKEKDDG